MQIYAHLLGHSINLVTCVGNKFETNFLSNCREKYFDTIETIRPKTDKTIHYFLYHLRVTIISCSICLTYPLANEKQNKKNNKHQINWKWTEIFELSCWTLDAQIVRTNVFLWLIDSAKIIFRFPLLSLCRYRHWTVQTHTHSTTLSLFSHPNIHFPGKSYGVDCRVPLPVCVCKRVSIWFFLLLLQQVENKTISTTSFCLRLSLHFVTAFYMAQQIKKLWIFGWEKKREKNQTAFCETNATPEMPLCISIAACKLTNENKSAYVV